MKTEGYPTHRHGVATKRFCRTLDLRNDARLIEEYRHRHQPDSIWPEIVEGIKAVGILEMEIYIIGNRLFMIVDTPLDFDWDKDMARLGSMPRQQEWEDYMSWRTRMSVDRLPSRYTGEARTMKCHPI